MQSRKEMKTMLKESNALFIALDKYLQYKESGFDDAKEYAQDYIKKMYNTDILNETQTEWALEIIDRLENLT